MLSNHEDAIASLMNEMREQQGYEEDNNDDHGSSSSRRRRKNRQKRLLPELDDYPSNTRLCGSQMIWNPYVTLSATPTSIASGAGNHNTFVGTNPQVEVVRRRVFERFKQETFEVVERMVQTTWPSIAKKIPIPSMLEKWHMDAKLQERRCSHQGRQHSAQQELESSSAATWPEMKSTIEIYRQIIQRQQEEYYDPILLSKSASPMFIPLFQQEIQKAWTLYQTKISSSSSLQPQAQQHPPKLGKKSKQLQKALHLHVCKALESFQQSLHQAANQSIRQMQQQQTSQKHRRKRQREQQQQQQQRAKLTTNHDDNLAQVTFAGNTFKIHTAYLEKLERLFDRAYATAAATDSSSTFPALAFENALFCMLCRYDMLQGAGLQAGVPGCIMDVLLKHLDCRMECFASPLNCRYQNYGSAFDDIDPWFGSFGNVFDLEFGRDGGCYQANPPFCEGLIAQLNDKLKSECSSSLSSTKPAKPLLFVVFVPAWETSSAAYQGLLDNPCLMQHVLLEQGKHWYTEGTQHRRKGSFRVASFDTSILFYGNQAAKTKWGSIFLDKDDNDDGSLLVELRNAFCENPGTMEKSQTKGNTSLTISSGKSPSSKSDRDVPTKNLNTAKEAKTATTAGGNRTNGEKLVAFTDSSSKKNHKKQDKKRKRWANADESKAQLDLLQSLGLGRGSASVEHESPQDSKPPREVSFTKSKKSSTKKRKKRGH